MMNEGQRLSIANLMLLWRTEGVALLPTDFWAILFVRALTVEDVMNEMFDRFYAWKMRFLERMA